MSIKNFTLRFVYSALVSAALLLGLTTPALAYFLSVNGEAAGLVLGQPNFTSNTAALATPIGMFDPTGVAVDPTSHKVFVADEGNCRVLRFASLYSLTSGAPADGVLGQPDFYTRTCLTKRNGMYFPDSVFVDGSGRLWVADAVNQRVLRFDAAAAKESGANADGVLGQPGYTTHTIHSTQNGMSNPTGVVVDAAGRLWVADSGNNRVLRFDNAAAKANGANADGVLGQPNFTASTAHTTQNRMYKPVALGLDLATGRLYVADVMNSRVLRFDNAASKPNGANANGVLGQPNFTSRTASAAQDGMAFPVGLALDTANDRLFVVDRDNNRIAIYLLASTLANGANANAVLGQPDFTTNSANTGGLSASSLYNPYGAFYDPYTQVVLAVEAGNNRLLMYGLPSHYYSGRSVAAVDGWVRESAQGSGVGGTLSATGTLRVGDDALNRQYRSILSFDTSGLPYGADVRSARVIIRQAGGVGKNPSLSFGPLLADINNGSFGAPALEAADFQAAASKIDFGYFVHTGKSLVPQFRVGLAPADYGNINVTGGLTQIRLHYNEPSNNDNLANYLMFYAGDATSLADRPILQVEYTVSITP